MLDDFYFNLASRNWFVIVEVSCQVRFAVCKLLQLWRIFLRCKHLTILYNFSNVILSELNLEIGGGIGDKTRPCWPKATSGWFRQLLKGLGIILGGFASSTFKISIICWVDKSTDQMWRSPVPPLNKQSGKNGIDIFNKRFSVAFQVICYASSKPRSPRTAHNFSVEMNGNKATRGYMWQDSYILVELEIFKKAMY